MADPSAPQPAPIPRTFLDHLRSMGPGLVVVLTWLGAGDIVDNAVSGGSYGYALMWALALALVMRWLFVSTIAKYQLCNQHGESVLEGLRRLHPWFPPFILVATLALSHAVQVYMYMGLGESCAALAGGGRPWIWALGWAVLFFLLLSRPVFRRIEQVFLVFLAILGVSLIGAAAWVGPDAKGIVAGTIGFQLPEQRGNFNALLVATSLIGAVAGSLANLMYPYFIREKGWTTPAHRRVQRYDLALGIAVIILLDLAVWVLGAEVLHAHGAQVNSIQDLAGLLGLLLGRGGEVLIYLGVFAAVGSSVVGNALAYGYMSVDAYLLWRPSKGVADPNAYRRHPGYRFMLVWCLFLPLPWVILGRGSFVPLTVTVNAFQVLLLPVLAMAMWILTGSRRYIGEKYRNRLWEQVGMALFLAMALLGAYGSVQGLMR